MTGTAAERVADAGRGISLAYDTFDQGTFDQGTFDQGTFDHDTLGTKPAEPVLLIAGLGQQLHSWPTAFCERLAAGGRQVIRFDNRDAGRSTHLDFRPPGPAAILTRRWPARQYDLTDLATDTVGLLDVLGHERAHLVGVSMGGMIAQTVAAQWPDRVCTLTSIMSTTGARRTGRPAPSTWRLMAGRPPRTREEAADRAVRLFRHIGSHGFPFDEAGVRETAGLAWDRDPTTGGTGRQLAAIFRSGDRTEQVRTITAPTLAIHGDRDRMVHPTGGAATARAVAGAWLETVPGLGHDLPEAAWPILLDLIERHVSRRGHLTGARSTDAPTTE